MERTGHFHDEVANGAAPESQGILDHPTAFDAAVDMFNPHPPPRQRLVLGFLFGCQRAATGLLGRLEHRDAVEREGEKAQILEQLAVGGQRVGRVIRNAFVMHPSFKGCAQKQDGQAGIDQEEILQRVALFLAAIVEGLFSRVRGARDGSLGTVVTKRGDVSAPGDGSAGCSAVVAARVVPKRSAKAA